ncbi:MAG: EF-hand domain-containing protein [Planctomycetes bacterium]|nr:EF-hand domain-containing protein [Planctomycetota bacterium]
MSIATDELINRLQHEFPRLLPQYDRNHDGTIDKCELLNLLMSHYCIPWNCANVMVCEIFQKLDKNGDCRLTINEVQGVCGCVCNFVSTINLVCPANNTVFCHFPRTTHCTWTPVATACVYQVDVQFQDGACWRPLTTGRVNCPCFQFEFVGAQPGRWQVTAFDGAGRKVAESEWRTFVYRV